MLFVCFLDDRIVSPTSVCLFFVDENSYPQLKQQFPELVRFGNSWLDVTTHSKTQALILHRLTVNFIGRGWNGKFEASFWGVKRSESILFSYPFYFPIPFYTLKRYQNSKNPVGRIDTLNRVRVPSFGSGSTTRNDNLEWLTLGTRVECPASTNPI